MCWYNRCFWKHSWCWGKKQSAFSPSTFTSCRHSTSSFQECTRRKLDPLSHICTLLCTYLTWRIVCFLNILLKLQKETKGTENKNKQERMHCVARVSIKFKAIFRAHRFFFNHHDWSSLVDSEWGSDHSLVDLVWEVNVYGRSGKRGIGMWKKGYFSFSLLKWKIKTKNYPQFFKIRSVFSL